MATQVALQTDLVLIEVLQDGQLGTNFERHFTAQGREYFATDVGRAELAQLASYIRTNNVKPPRR